MSDTDLHIALMEAGRMNLMHLPPGAIAWLWDRPSAQVDAAEALAVAANAYGNPVVDASLLKADQNVMLIKCQGGECFRIYPDGGYSHEDTPMDIGGCSSVLQGVPSGDCGCPTDDMGHAMDPSPGDGYNDATDQAEPMERAGNPEHLNDHDPHAEVQDPANLTNLAGEPLQDEHIFDDEGDEHPGDRIGRIIRQACGMDEPVDEDLHGNAAGDGMGTGSPYVGDMGNATDMLDNQMMSRELGEFRIKDLDEDDLQRLAESLDIDFL